MKQSTEETVRVVCNLPVTVNQKLQAQASLDGVSKQQLIADVLIAFADELKLSHSKKVGA